MPGPPLAPRPGRVAPDHGKAFDGPVPQPHRSVAGERPSARGLVSAGLEHPVSAEAHRFAVDARRHSEFGGGMCTVLVRRIDDRVELLFHASPETGAVMTPAQAILMAQALTTAAENRGPTPGS